MGKDSEQWDFLPQVFSEVLRIDNCFQVSEFLFQFEISAIFCSTIPEVSEDFKNLGFILYRLWNSDLIS